ncbi:MAG: hypothetical protein J6M14_01500 [Campylobacter sp.]|nr:hypothetical protein [Campylobacter sp.]
MGNFILPCRKGTGKKVANIGNFAKICFINGEIPPLPKDKSEAEFYASRGITSLGDEFEVMIFNTFLKCVKNDENGLLSLNFDLVKEYSAVYEIPLITLSEILNAVLAVVNKAIHEKNKNN